MIADVCCYAREKLNLDMVCVSHGPKDALARRKGGIGFASLQLLQGSFIIVVQRVWCRAARSCLPFGFQAIKQRQTSCPLEDQLAQAELPPVSVL